MLDDEIIIKTPICWLFFPHLPISIEVIQLIYQKHYLPFRLNITWIGPYEKFFWTCSEQMAWYRIIPTRNCWTISHDYTTFRYSWPVWKLLVTTFFHKDAVLLLSPDYQRMRKPVIWMPEKKQLHQISREIKHGAIFIDCALQVLSKIIPKKN